MLLGAAERDRRVGQHAVLRIDRGGLELDVLADRIPGRERGRDDQLRRRLRSVTVLGPANIEGGLRWLVQGPDLTAARTTLRALAGEWRNAGATLRIDVDPIDL